MRTPNTSLRDRVVVITGASSGIGRETAVQFASLGCRVVLAARREGNLRDVAILCEAVGGEALVVVTDVTSEAEVNRLAETAVRELGRIDIWINNAGVTLFGFLDEGPFSAHRRVIETNVLGAMLCARAVLPRFKAQGFGTLVNVGSLLSKVAQPFVPSYVISKFALRGLTEALRAEIAEHEDIHVCSVFAFASDTPHFEEGANFRGKRPHPISPIQSPETIARAIVDLAAHPRHEVHVPSYMVLGVAVHQLFPRTVERVLLRTLSRFHFDDEPEQDNEGNLTSPSMQDGTVHGSRPPLASMATLVAWSVAELLKIEASTLAREVRGWKRLVTSKRTASVEAL